MENLLLDKNVFYENYNNYMQYVKEKEEILIWGNELSSANIIELIKNENIWHKVIGFVTNDKDLWGGEIQEKRIFSPFDIVNNLQKNNVLVIIAAQQQSAIQMQLEEFQVPYEKIDLKGFGLSKDYLIYKDNQTPFEVIQDNLLEIRKTFDLLQDQKSKMVLSNILNSKITLDNSYLNGIASPPVQQYFDEELISLNEGEVFIDCGSFNGDTLKSFLNFSNGTKYKKYIAIEADPKIYKDLLLTIENEKAEDVLPINIACWFEEATLSFMQQSSSGSVNTGGAISVQANSLDNLFSDDEITFIKMDIEGAEQNALLGAKNLIDRNSPILAICLYHNLEDYFKIPLMINEMNSEYKFYIRHYTERVDVETVCYAIPKNRLKQI